MKKPKPQTKTALDYSDCMKYIDEKYGIKNRDYAGCHGKDGNPENPYQDFWHAVLGSYHPTKASYFLMPVKDTGTGDYHDTWLVDEDEKWAVEILELIRKEFEEYIDENGFIEFWNDW